MNNHEIASGGGIFNVYLNSWELHLGAFANGVTAEEKIIVSCHNFPRLFRKIWENKKPCRHIL